MTDLVGILATLFDLSLVVIGFALIVTLHELGHFLAARWAGIRVLAFAVGFGPAAFSYRKGLGIRKGSSEREYLQLLRTRAGGHADAREVSPTEYRLNWLPLGGYVKMLGQEDFDPTARSAEPDSYQSCPPWKRLIVISAGVVANIITAAILFIFVFMIGLRSEPAAIGTVFPGSAAASAVATNADDLGIDEPGLMPGDRVLSVNGERPRHFNDLNLAIVMSERDEPVDLLIEREGFDEPVEFRITPRVSDMTGLLEIGIGPPHTPNVVEPPRSWQRRRLAEGLKKVGLEGVQPGMRLVSAGSQPIESADDLASIVQRSEGRDLALRFESPDGEDVAEPVISPMPELELAWVLMPSDRHLAVEHVAGLVGVMGVRETQEGGKRAGLRKGDVFVRIGGTDFPSVASGIAEIQAAAGSSVPITVGRFEDGEPRTVDLDVPVGKDGRVGFTPDDGLAGSRLLAGPLTNAKRSPRDTESTPLPAASALNRPGLELVSIDGAPIEDLLAARTELMRLSREAIAAGNDELTVTLGVRDPLAEPVPDGGEGSEPGPPLETIGLTLRGEDLRSVASLSWGLPFSMSVFELEQFRLRADDPLHAIMLGVAETNRVMVTTYLTFARLFQGTVKIEHLKGPVGIAHLGTRIAERGLIWLLFFLALISVNLAVINFLPLPIVDGGQFLMILYEMIRGKPVPIGFQSAITLVGLVLIGAMFLIVTYHDLVGLFGG